MIGFYSHKSFSLNIECLETVYINNQTIPHFVNLWSKKVPVNISCPSIFDQVDCYLDVRISPSFVRYTLTIEKNQYKKMIRKRIHGGGFHRLLKQLTKNLKLM